MAHARVLLIGALVFGVGSGTASAQEPLLFPINPPRHRHDRLWRRNPAERRVG